MESPRRILIIDDEADFIATMRFFLENAGFTLMAATTADEGLALAARRPDLILLDLTMPGLSGHEVCKRLKEDSVTASIPVIMLTSQDRVLDKVEAFNLGAADYIGKQFSFEEILARIKAALRTAAPQEALTQQKEQHEKILHLREIINGRKIRTMYQSIVEMRSRQPIGFEALSRGPKGDFLENPLDLFALATQVDMLVDLELLCLSCSLERASFIKPGQLLFLNFDPLEITSESLIRLILGGTGAIKPNQISVEITERTCVKNFEQLIVRLREFIAQGIQISIDDVGEGYSSLNAIAALKPSFIKVNINLVRGVHEDMVKQNLISVIVDLARRLGSHIIAEGVETEDEYRMLCKLGAEYGQGYLFARPQEYPVK